MKPAATYTGSATSSYVKGYVVTADYSGTVSRIALNKVRYVAIFDRAHTAHRQIMVESRVFSFFIGCPPRFHSRPRGVTEVTSELYYSDGSLGTLKIPSIGLTVKVFEGTGSTPLLKGAGHFEGPAPAIWEGTRLGVRYSPVFSI